MSLSMQMLSDVKHLITTALFHNLGSEETAAKLFKSEAVKQMFEEGEPDGSIVGLVAKIIGHMYPGGRRGYPGLFVGRNFC